MHYLEELLQVEPRVLLGVSETAGAAGAGAGAGGTVAASGAGIGILQQL